MHLKPSRVPGSSLVLLLLPAPKQGAAYTPLELKAAGSDLSLPAKGIVGTVQARDPTMSRSCRS